MIDESALRRRVGDNQVMIDQLEHLVEQSHLPHVTVQVLPFDMGAHPGINGQYAILEFPDAADSSVVYIEGVTSDLYLEKANDVQRYSDYEHLRAQALNVEQTREFISKIAKSYTS
ncbi:Helix-turn-helix domain-containing protein OS=Streptomyces microflavus OX=1919 GN=HUT09_14060 PE=4 SV=1 [Streptomyces microflavus]